MTQVLVPDKMYVLSSKAAIYPLNVISLADARPAMDESIKAIWVKVSSLSYDGETVCTGMKYCSSMPAMSTLIWRQDNIRADLCRSLCVPILLPVQVPKKEYLLRGLSEDDTRDWFDVMRPIPQV